MGVLGVAQVVLVAPKEGGGQKENDWIKGNLQDKVWGN